MRDGEAEDGGIAKDGQVSPCTCGRQPETEIKHPPPPFSLFAHQQRADCKENSGGARSADGGEGRGGCGNEGTAFFCFFFRVLQLFFTYLLVRGCFVATQATRDEIAGYIDDALAAEEHMELSVEEVTEEDVRVLVT